MMNDNETQENKALDASLQAAGESQQTEGSLQAEADASPQALDASQQETVEAETDASLQALDASLQAAGDSQQAEADASLQALDASLQALDASLQAAGNSEQAEADASLQAAGDNQQAVAEITPVPTPVSKPAEVAHAITDLIIPVFEFAEASKDNLLTYFGQIKDIALAHAHANTFKKIDEATKEAKAAWEQLKQAEKQAALDAFKASNEDSEEGFSFRDEASHAIDELVQTIRKEKQNFFQHLEKSREKALEVKTRLINELRALVDADDNSDPAHVNASYKAFKKIQDEWKGLGSVQGPMNQTLWQSYHALVDRYYSNRSIFFELLELDRKKNLQAKAIIAAKLEKLAAEVTKTINLPGLLKEAEELFNEYKLIGPAQREENEAMWQRVKKSLDVLFEQKRQIQDAQKGAFEENLKIKKELGDLMKHYANFQSTGISEWNQASKAVLALQEQWGKLKGGLPREGGKEVSQHFWADLKTFFKHKSEFFAKIDAERKANLAAKQQLIDQVEGIVAVGTETQEITQTVIELQKKWKEIGHVPEKQKDSIYAKFKAACDAYFNLKRNASKGVKGVEMEANLASKEAILAEMKGMLADATLLAKLGEIKAHWDAIGFVPRQHVKTVQENFRKSWNALIDFARTQPKEQLAAWGFELTSLQAPEKKAEQSGSNTSMDTRKKILTLENDIAVLTNNLEFFAKSKNAGLLRAEVEKKIAQAENDLANLRKE